MTAVPEGGFTDGESLRTWLESLPEEDRRSFAQTIAHRASMRTLPYANQALSNQHYDPDGPNNPALVTFRIYVVSRIASKFPTQEVEAAAISAAAAFVSVYPNQEAQAELFVISNSLSDTTSAVLAACARRVSASCASPDADIVAELWKNVTDDALVLMHDGSNAIGNKPLWSSSGPEWWMEEWMELQETLLSLDEGHRGDEGNGKWRVWLDWYQARVTGKSPWGLPEAFAENLELRIALGSKRKGFWSQKPEVINAEISDWLDAAREQLASTSKSRVTIAEKTATDTPKIVPQTPGAIQFDGGDDEPISVRHRASVEDWDTGSKATKRHSELLRLIDSLLGCCQERMQTTDSVRELLEDIRLFRDALGATVHDFDPDFAIPRGDGLRQTLSAYEKDDNFSKLPPISDDVLLALGKAIPAYNQFISLDDHLAKRDEALLGPDARKRMVGPKEGQPIIEAAVEAGAAKPEVKYVLDVEALPAPDQPDPENRASRRYSESNKNFARRAIEKAWEYAARISVTGAVGAAGAGIGGGWAAAKWVWEYRDWLLSVFAENPTMLKIVQDLLEILAKLPLG